MNNSKLKKWGLCILVLIVLKTSFSLATINQLQWFLEPIVTIVELFTRINFTWTADVGFTSNTNIIIEKSCSGTNFYTICLLLLMIKDWNSFNIQGKLLRFLSLIVISFFITILANSMRIISALKLASFPELTNYINPKSSHLILGSIIYILILLSLNHLITKNHEQA
ncbi:MAG: exosortase K [Flavobacteriaceae bacterium]|nr:exosortase K [Flavobacteriaceae bacterium]